MKRSLETGQLLQWVQPPLQSAETAASGSWLEYMDINEADIPYAGALLAETFSKWLEESAEFDIWNRYSLFLFDRQQEQIAGPAVPAEQQEAMAGLISEAMRTGAVAGPKPAEDKLVYGVPVMSRSAGLPFAALGFITGDRETVADSTALLAMCLHFRSLFYQGFERLLTQETTAKRRLQDKENERRDAMFQTAKRLYDQIDVSSVLKETVQSLESLYPGSTIDLFLSQDYTAVDPRVKPLVFKHSSSDICARAFLEGKPVSERDADGVIHLAVPFSGKQAVYGVLQVSMTVEQWKESNRASFMMLADTAGSAFENAKLYEQSNLLIGELQVINELTKRLNQSLKLSEIFGFATGELLQVFQAEYCCILKLNKQSGCFEVVSGNIPSMLHEQFLTDYGFCGIVNESKEALIISDYKGPKQTPSKLMESTNARSLIASPIMVEGEVGGVILVAHRVPNYFSYDNYKLLQVLSTHIGLAITNATLHAEVRRMVITDNLTGLHARHYLDEQISLRQREDACGSLILVDIDYFKRVNDTYGHQIGDRILKQVSGVIKSCIRETDIAARWGGEELAVYLPKVRTDQAYRIADRIRHRVESETEPRVTASCGISEWTYEDDKISVESLFYRADMAMYDAKHHGRNQVQVG
ncbi:sensor domain-containing diguanylate cyclase [Paenibacillus tarimensis]|uniref:sensor domain-containing diguanylate cyclase n=1 Tax=Paenibacillus tarimensis TaxID=416012 RepID=UPI001F3D45D7|nr:sensor domain-containing diguanylate cyclase [Paenibacillus tarimensis]MCF2942193.1 sensor domain-containing diguanylate cyclase [Paenibacillus tarimensis]